MIIEGRFSIQSNEQDDRNFNKVLAEGIIDKDGSVMVDKLQGWRKGVLRKHYDNLEDLLSTLENVRCVYHIDADDYSHEDPEWLRQIFGDE